MIQVLFTELLEQVQDSKCADSGFKKEAQDSVLKEVQEVYSGPYPIPLYKIKQKEQVYKVLYKDWKFLQDQSGFGQDEEIQMVTVPDQVWDSIIKVSNYYSNLYSNQLMILIQVRKSCKQYRNNSLPFTHILSELYDDSIATGEYTRTLTPGTSILVRKYSRTRTEPSEVTNKK